jgi:hypothetical protein
VIIQFTHVITLPDSLVKFPNFTIVCYEPSLASRQRMWFICSTGKCGLLVRDQFSKWPCHSKKTFPLMQILLGILTTTISIHHSSKAALSITQTRLCNYIESLFVERARNYVYVMAWQWMTENNNHMTFFICSQSIQIITVARYIIIMCIWNSELVLMLGW